MKIYGIDCGKDKIHIVGDTGAKDFIVKSGTPRDESLTYLKNEVSKWLTVHGCTHFNCRLYIEEPVLAGARNIRTTIAIAETVGMLLSLGFPATLVPVSTWKKSVLGLSLIHI